MNEPHELGAWMPARNTGLLLPMPSQGEDQSLEGLKGFTGSNK